MNKFILAFIIFLITIINVQGQWEILNDGIYGRLDLDLNIIDFINEDIGWISTGPALLKTEDGGETWHYIYLDEDLSIGSIDFVSDTVGWALGSSVVLEAGIIARTRDGGITWVVKKQLQSGLYPGGIYAVNDRVVFVVGRKYYQGGHPYNKGFILKTTDGGITWTETILYVGNDNTYFHSVKFINRNLGIVLGTYSANGPNPVVIYKTYDGGQTWEEQLVPEFSEIYDLQFINDSTGYFLAYNENDEYILCETMDMCNSWIIITQSVFPIHSYQFLTIDTVFAVMEDSISTNIVKSSDGGLNWENKQLVHGESPKKIYFKEDEVGFLIECDGALGWGWEFLWKSNDGGEDWLIQKVEYPLNDVYFFSDNVGLLFGGWVVCWHMGCIGPIGSVLMTIDGGQTWDVNFTHQGILISCSFINNLLGFTLSDGFAINKTHDSGNNWTEVYSDSYDSTFSFSGNDLCFINEMNGWAVGSVGWAPDSGGAAILGTSDGGENWDLVWTYPDTEGYRYELHSIHTVGTTAWAMGECGQMVKYTSSDQWQLITSITDLPLREVFFSDEDHGWIAGGYFNDDNVFLKLFKTTDAGASWQEIPDFNYQINDMYFENSTHGWAVGNDTSYQGIILETSDGGQNWMVQVNGLSAPLNALHFQGDYGWAVGENGLVLRTDDGASWVDQISGKVYPTSVKLYQNYPNPFNPTTTIEFELPRASKVTLKIYNILGEEVATLLSGSLNSGSHSIEWSRPAGIASGIYFYRLCAMNESGKFEKSKKLLLLK
jgi:photosystem II stability/assembly factor-like uncharacterized protein